MPRKIRVLLLDDSLLFRALLSRGLAKDASIEVVAQAVDPYDAIQKIEDFQPDVMTCDVEMPKMNGIEFIRQLMPQHPLPIIVVSGVSNVVFDAMNAGAIDFISKPNIQSPHAVSDFMRHLIEKIHEASIAKIVAHKPIIKDKEVLNPKDFDQRIIAIGASTGGTQAIYTLLKALPSNLPGIVIVQHIPPVFSKLFAERLNNQTGLTVCEAKSGDLIEPGKVLIAPGDQHMRVKKVGNHYLVDVFEGEKVNGHCPSVDVLFDAVAKVYQDKALGVILTGMGYDGAKGMLTMLRKGARTLGQDEATSVVYGMPKVAFEVGAVERQLPLNRMAEAICHTFKK